MTVDRETALRENNALWDEWTRIHETSAFYDLDGFKRGGDGRIRLRPYELEEIGPVDGLDVLHLQCHFGMDTLSFARLGARVTGADFSHAAVELARRVAVDIGHLDARFVESDVYDLPNALEGDFDLVYTSRGVLGWLPDIRGWARVIAHFVRPGGRFYITEIHPVAQAFENEGVAPGELRLSYPYWEHVAPLTFDVQGSYAEPAAQVAAEREHGWDHSLGEIVSSLVDAGLRIESLREYPFCEWKLDFLEEHPDGTSRLPSDLDGRLPLFFSVLASKPA
ncbi:MAG TPA: class I SAM-dependent methyltransferase [Candidatus Limnocylindrales bacterium]|nr:class I SAM-dependent methyltransferase [Candidatus Limnocylindrales bacterium]